jgi:hypothetical protein
MTRFSYDGRRFRVAGTGDAPLARYHQREGVLWGEFAGGKVQRGALAGSATPEGVIDFGYSMLLTGGELVIGRCHSEPELLADGRIRLVEHWERYSPHAATGISCLEELFPHEQPPTDPGMEDDHGHAGHPVRENR